MHSWRTGLRAATALLGVSVATSCDGPSGPSVNPVDYLLAEADGSWSNSAASFMALAHTPSTPVRVSADDCKYSFNKTAFVCPKREWGGLTFELSYQLLDANNTSLPWYEANTVAALRTITTVSGTWRYDSATTEVIASSGDRMLSGLLSGDPTINGTESATYILKAASFSDTTYAASAITNFKVPPRNSPQFPTGIIATAYYSAPPASAPSPDGTFTMTFDGTQFAKFVWSFSGYSRMCTLDLKGISQTTCTP